MITRVQRLAGGTSVLVLWVVLACGCEPPEADQTSAPAAADDDGQPAEVGPEGPADIDHGGITEVADDPELIAEGERLFASKGCTACHGAEDRGVGPALGGVTQRREPQWIARMILHPDQMLQRDPITKELLAEYLTPMPNQGVTPEEARALMAYLGTLPAQ